ncbi:MAG: YqgE/AlgH family protein [Saprospiraceae bacterium]|nr:YqgE/AlgH family protein [Saprospiraceae bacterium]
MKAKKTDTELKAGTLLLAEPYMLDPNFKRGVILICEHHEEGSLGFIYNKPIGMQVQQLLPDFPDFKAEVFYGGPVQKDTIHYLHTRGDLLEDSVEVASGLFWGGDFNKLKFLIKDGRIQENEIRFFVGYSGWGKGQLEEEMKVLSWITYQNAQLPQLLSLDSLTMWKTILEQKGEQFGVIAQMELPCWN